MQKTDWLSLVAVLALAIALRVLFYTGFFGSDEVTYVETAANIAAGDWRASNYIGATRYGMNLPVALSISLFGLSEASANVWPLFCSVGEVAIVFTVARWLWNTRTAIVCASLLALLPLHVHFAGRMMADPPLAFFLSLSVALMLRAASSKYWLNYLAAGLAWGGVFWVKESVALLYLPVFLILGAYLNRISSRWLWLFAGMALAVAANCVLMNFVAGNPMYLFVVMKQNVTTYAAGGLFSSAMATSPWYYLRYLFLDIRHTFLLGFLVAAGSILYARYFIRDKQVASGAQFVVLWMLLLVGMFSFAVVSFSPVKLITKQTNYMLIFVGPLALLAGWFLASLPRRVFVPLAALVVCGSVVLAALEQQAIAVFTANSKAVYFFLRDHPSAYLVGTTNNERAINFFSMMEHRRELRERIISFGELAAVESSNATVNLAIRTSGKNVFTVLDLQNIDWGNKPGGIKRLSDVPKCWTSMGTLTPAALGNGRWVAKGLIAAGAVLPASLQQRYMSALQPVAAPAPAYLFRVDHSCLAS
ncbi:ArnT family glycosyltransferase [Rhodoferax ferrireducens]|uniref:ArnT family glycosyltransferase n=1 Tax=Rhodoferax ferrireducens TaxID=192843 RepID=UPI000E0D56F8|nr:glycosyltransferase family 39 protein [Rhodoferax ferrireducens]